MILAFVKESSVGRPRQEINDYIYQQMNEYLKVKNNRIRMVLTYLRKKIKLSKVMMLAWKQVIIFFWF